MDGDESGLTSYYHHHHHPQHHHPTTTTPTTASNTNGVFSDPHHHQQQHHQHQQHQHQHQQQQQQHNQSAGHYSSEPTPLAYPQHSVTGRAPPPPPPSLTSSTPPPPPETVKRKRGRPRKYGTPEALQAASASVSSAKKLSTSSPSSVPLPSSPRKKDPSSLSSSKKNQLSALGNAGQNFIPHIITVTAGEDVAQKIMSFMQQRKRAVCILSASGSVSNASLRQPATLGGTVTYEGRFEILSLSGSFLHTEIEGGSSRTGGLSVCLSGTDGRIIGGGVGGPLKAAGPVQVIIGSFVIDNKETNVESKFETSSSKLPQVIGATFSSAVYGSPDSSGRNSGRGNNDHQNMGVNNFMIQSRGMHSMPSQSNDWRDSPGLTDHGACQSSEDGDDGNLQH